MTTADRFNLVDSDIGRLEAPTREAEMPCRVLVVDDFQPFRLFVCSMLQDRPALRVVREAADGLEAIQEAEELQPDLILLDIGLPKLNGIEAARRIRKLSAQSRILFVSQESSADVVEEALSLGAWGYVVKAHAGSELLAAVEAVCQGRRFVSSGLSGDSVVEVSSTQTRGRLGRAGALTPGREIIHSHEVEFYRDDESLLAGFTRFIEAALRMRNPVVVIATPSRRNRLLQRLQARGWDMATALQEGSYISLDVSDALSRFMVHDWPDSARLSKLACDLMEQAAKASKRGRPRVAACGECAPTLWAQGKREAAIQVEHLWDEIARSHDIDILCGYLADEFQRTENRHIYERICREHSAVCSH